MEMKVLYHECTDENGSKLPVEFCDGNGFVHVVPFGEPTEFENGFIATKILEHMRYMGIVEVKYNKSRTGITYNMEDAIDRAHKALVMQEKACINDYIRIQLESRVSKNFPPLPPVGRYLTCVIKHKVNLLKYGLRPIGWEPPYEVEAEGGVYDTQVQQAVSSGSADERLRQLENLVRTQQQLIDNMIRVQQNTRPPAASVAPLVHASVSEILASDAAPPPPSRIQFSEGSDETAEELIAKGIL